MTSLLSTAPYVSPTATGLAKMCVPTLILGSFKKGHSKVSLEFTLGLTISTLSLSSQERCFSPLIVFVLFF